MQSRSWINWSLGALVALSSVPASAMTRAQCDQQYATKKAAGQTGGQSQAAFVKACLAAADPPPAGAEASQGAAGTEASQGGAESTNKLREAAQNPVADLISLQFQDNPAFIYGPYHGTQNVLNFQPVIPIHLNEDWNLIARPITPIVRQPRLAPDLGPEFGLSNIEPELFLSPAHPGEFIWGLGPALYLPTATDKTLGTNAWGAGPGAVGLTIQEPWIVGAVFNNVWAWRNGQKVDAMTLQYFVNYNLPEGWYLASQPIITADWRARAEDKWVVPVGGGVGRVFKLEDLPPINAQVQAFYNAVRPTAGPVTGPIWSLRFQR